MVSATAIKWDIEADVVVVGSGGAGLTAAILAHDQGAQVVILEASDKVGGTTAVSGGGLWIPLNHHMAEAGIEDSRKEALAYAKSQTLGKAPDELVETVIDTGPQLVRYLEEHTGLKFMSHIPPMPDYQMHLPGAKIGRDLAPALFSKKELGEWEGRLRPGWAWDLPIADSDFTEVRPWLTPQALPWEAIGELMEKGITGGGNALAAGLFAACLTRKISTCIETRGRELVCENGRVVGLRAERNGKDFLAKARGGVVLASGGFDWNQDLKSKFLPGPLTHPACPPSLLGDGLVMAMEIGADLGNMSEIWGIPTVIVPGEEYDGRQLNRLCMNERFSPHTILVNRHGERFVNEAGNYNDMSKAFNYFDPNAFDFRNLPAWAILDSQYREKYALLTLLPGDPDPDWLTVDQTVVGLARKVGIHPDGLQATVARFNGFVREGTDRDFHRGESPLDRWWGDPKATHPNLGTIEKPPFYALPVYPGSLGTKGGPRTNKNGQVLNVRGQIIPGLYAAGNVMAGVSGPSYWGPGTTISLALIWGYICGISAAKEARGAAG